ncbi:MAG: hypothetical protein ACFE95_06605 [Candidatus Hodarchaeota archaeon]
MEDQYTANVAMRGRLVDLMTAEEETVKEEWQTKSLENHIKKAGLRKRGYTMPLAEDVREMTADPGSIDLVREFMPDIELSGWELRAERHSKSWGGSYFRVLESTKEDKDTKCIQWIFVWTKQRFFISLWLTVLPLFLLAITGTLIYSFLSFQSAMLSVALIGSIFFFLGAIRLYSAIKGLTKGIFYFSNQQLFLVFGALFWLLLPELYISKGSQGTEIDERAEAFHELPVGQEFIDEVSQAAIGQELALSWVALLFFLAGILALILWKWEPPSFTHVTHDMDWAPFFIYLHKDKSDKWKLEKVRYDAFHYFAETKTKDELLQRRSISASLKKVRFEIPNFWHSFQPRGGFSDWFAVFFGMLVTLVSAVIGVVSFVSTSESFLGSNVLRFVVFPVLLFAGLYLIFSKWPTKIINAKKIDLSDEKYHLTDNRLRMFWNLRGEEPALKVRSKMQDPFMEDEDFGTFRDDLEQIVFYSLLPRIHQLEQKEFFKIL